MQVHDELVLEVPDDEVELTMRRVPELMSRVADLRVPLLTEIGVGVTGTKLTSERVRRYTSGSCRRQHSRRQNQ